MKKIKKIMGGLFTVSFFGLCFLFTSLSFGQEMPTPGTLIDKSNYKKYMHVLPEGIAGGFEDGWGGVYPPITMRVTASHSYPSPLCYRELSEKNRGKFTVDKEGMIQTAFDYMGEPFPGVVPSDDDFIRKFMWNYAWRYSADSIVENRGYNKRKGETSLSYTQYQVTMINFTNRFVEPPMPFYKTPSGLKFVNCWKGMLPGSMKNVYLMSYRYLDPLKQDDTYIYVPSLRRILRGEAGQRSTPISGAILSLDDVHGFDGRTQEWDFKFIGKQKILGISDGKINQDIIEKQYGNMKDVPWPVENYELQDVYVIEMKNKDPLYPQSKHLCYVNVENPWLNYWGVAWDRAGVLWKFYNNAFSNWPMPGGRPKVDNIQVESDVVQVDMQFGMSSSWNFINQKFKNGMRFEDTTPAALVGRGR